MSEIFKAYGYDESLLDKCNAKLLFTKGTNYVFYSKNPLPLYITHMNLFP
jgi:hypothetical protein